MKIRFFKRYGKFFFTFFCNTLFTTCPHHQPLCMYMLVSGNFFNVNGITTFCKTNYANSINKGKLCNFDVFFRKREERFTYFKVNVYDLKSAVNDPYKLTPCHGSSQESTVERQREAGARCN